MFKQDSGVDIRCIRDRGRITLSESLMNHISPCDTVYYSIVDGKLVMSNTEIKGINIGSVKVDGLKRCTIPKNALDYIEANEGDWIALIKEKYDDVNVIEIYKLDKEIIKNAFKVKNVR